MIPICVPGSKLCSRRSSFTQMTRSSLVRLDFSERACDEF